VLKIAIKETNIDLVFLTNWKKIQIRPMSGIFLAPKHLLKTSQKV
jgi:hypothetical protein